MIPQIEPDFGVEEASALELYIFSGGWGTEHKYTKTFEELVADFVDVGHCSAVVNGTIGLSLALLALGIKPGDKVIVPALTMIASANAVKLIGAEPVFVDVEPKTLCLDIDQALKADAKAVIYVSLNGRCGDIEKLKGKFPIVEDACQSLGSYHNGRALGTIGDIGVYSLSPHKIISTGQGGLVVTNNSFLHEKVEELKDFGRLSGGSDYHPVFGINAKFTDFQAVIGIEQLKKIEKRIQRKREIYALYKDMLGDLMLAKTPDVPWMVDGYFFHTEHSEFQTRPMYPVIPNQPCYGETKIYPVAEKYSKRGVWLPSSPTLTDQQVVNICKLILND